MLQGTMCSFTTGSGCDWVLSLDFGLDCSAQWHCLKPHLCSFGFLFSCAIADGSRTSSICFTDWIWLYLYAPSRACCREASLSSVVKFLLLKYPLNFVKGLLVSHMFLPEGNILVSFLWKVLLYPTKYYEYTNLNSKHYVTSKFGLICRGLFSPKVFFTVKTCSMK